MPTLAFAHRSPRPARQPLLAAAATPAPRPLRAGEYLRLRREAHGLTIAQAASRLSDRADERAHIRDVIRQLEHPGAVARSDSTLIALRRAFPFDRAVYRQLAEDSAARHPHVCRGCGASKYDQARAKPCGVCGPECAH